MDKHYDVKKEWEKTKKQLIKFGKEASQLAKKGEKEIVRLSQQTKVHLDASAISLKKEKLYYQIGKECVKLQDLASPTPALKKLVQDYDALDKTQRSLLSKTKGKAVKKKSRKSTSKTKAKKKTVRKTVKRKTKKSS